MTSAMVYENNLVADFNREVLDKEVNYKSVLKIVAGVAVAAVIGAVSFISSNHGVSTQIDVPAKEYFGDDVSTSDANFAEGLVYDYFAGINVEDTVSEIRSESTFAYDNADAEARAIELLASNTELVSIDKVTSIEDEYRVYVTINTVDAKELMNSNRAFLSQAFCSNKNELTENGINKVVLEVIEKDAEADYLVETYLTVKDGTVDASQFISVLVNTYVEMRSVDL